MTFLQPPVPFRRRVAGGPARGTADDAIVAEPGMSEPDRVASTMPASAGPSVSEEPGADAARVAIANPTPLRLFGFAALSGAVAAAVVALVVSAFPLRSTDDPRTLQLIHDLSDLTARVQTLGDKTRITENESVAANQTVSAIDRRLTTATGELDAIRAAIGALTVDQQRARDAASGVNAPALFGVAAVQLRDRIEAGQPFEWELVDLRGIVGSDPVLLADLDRLAPMAATGVVTQTRLIEAMQALLAQDGPRSSLVQAGLGVASRVFGPSIISPPAADPQVLAVAMARLAAADLPNFVRVMQGLSAPSAIAARPLVVAAQRRMVALEAVQGLLRAARADLQTQLKSATAATVTSRP